MKQGALSPYRIEKGQNRGKMRTHGRRKSRNGRAPQNKLQETQSSHSGTNGGLRNTQKNKRMELAEEQKMENHYIEDTRRTIIAIQNSKRTKQREDTQTWKKKTQNGRALQDK